MCSMSYGYVMGLWLSVLDKVCSGFGAEGIGEKGDLLWVNGEGAG